MQIIPGYSIDFTQQNLSDFHIAKLLLFFISHNH